MLRNTVTLACALIAGSAIATPVTVSLHMTGFADAFGGQYVPVKTNVTSGWIGAGELQGQMTASNGGTSTLLTYCTDLFQFLSTTGSYTYTEVGTGEANGFSALQADRLGKLYTLYGLSIDTLDKSAAFQLAVWEIVTETGDTLDLQSGSFKLTAIGSNKAPRNLANTWLAAVQQDSVAPSYSAMRLYNANVQDLVMFSAMPQPPAVPLGPTGIAPLSANQVPEPASFALVGLALAGLLATRRRQR